MREVIYLDKKENEKPVEFTHFLCGSDGWTDNFSYKPESCGKIIYLGNSPLNGDMFSAYIGDAILIYKGHLNSGKY